LIHNCELITFALVDLFALHIWLLLICIAFPYFMLITVGSRQNLWRSCDFLAAFLRRYNRL